MKTLIFKCIALVVMSFFVASCTEDQATEQTARMAGIITNITPSVTYDSTIWNSANPYDSIGYWHNMGEDYIVAHKREISKTDGQAFINSMASLSAEFANSLGGGELTASELKQGVLDLNTAAVGFENNGSGFIKSKFNSRVAPYLISIFNTVMQLNSAVPVSNVVSSIKTIENDAIANNSLTTEDKKVILVSSSVSKFSSVYWSAKATNEQSDWSLWGDEVAAANGSSEPRPYINVGVAVVGDGISAATHIDMGKPWYEVVGYSAVTSGWLYCTTAWAAAGEIGSALLGAAVSLISMIF